MIHLFLAAALFLSAGCSQEAKKQGSLERGDEFFQSGEFQKAAIEYLNVVRLERTNSLAIQRLGMAYFELGHLARALPFLHEARRLEPENMDVLERIGLIYLAAREYPKARELAEIILRLDPTHSTALLLLADAAQTDDDIQRCREFLDLIREHASGRAAYHLAVANLHFKSREISEAEEALRQAQRLEPDSTIVLRSLGNVYMARNDPETAAQYFVSAAQHTPAHSDERMQLIEFKLRTGETAEAKRMLEEMEQAVPDYFPALLFRARIALAEQNYEECLEFTRRVLKRDRSNLEARLLEARVALAQGEAGKARESLEQLRARFPEAPAVHYHLALVFLAENEPAKAGSRLTEAIRLQPNYDEAILLLAELDIGRGNIAPAVISLQQLIARQPNQFQAHLLLAMAYRVRGTPADAVAIYQELMEGMPRNAHIPYLLGITHRQQNQNAQARAMFERSLELAPDGLLPIGQLTELDILEKKFADGSRRLEDKIAEHPDLPWPRFLLAQIHFAEKDTAKAERALLDTIERSDDFRPAYLMLAQIYVRSDRTEEALSKLNRALARHPEDQGALLQKAVILQEAGQHEQAAETYEALIRLNPNSATALNNLAYIYAENLGRLDRAHALGVRARSVLSDNPQVADTLGWIFHKRREYDRALPLLRESAEKLPTEPAVLYHLGMTHYMRGEAALARNMLQQALDLGKEFAHAAAAREKLAVLNLDPASINSDELGSLEEQFAQADDVILGLKCGQAWELQGNWERAGSVYERLLRRHPTLVPAMVNLARMHLKDPSRLDAAGQLLRNARNLSPHDPQIGYLLGQYAYGIRDFKWAVSLLQDSASRLRQEPRAQLDLGRALLALGRLEQASEAIQRGLTLDTHFPGADEGRAILEMLDLHRSIEGAGSQRERVNTLLEASPDFLPALLVMGQLEERDGRITQAQTIYQRILARYPDFTPAAECLDRIASEQENEATAEGTVQANSEPAGEASK
jgi:tetratricopeptide (TPR) repeat protein